MSSLPNSIIGIKDFFDRHKGLQRNNRYSVSFPSLPQGLTDVNPEDFQTLAVSMGSRAIDAIADNLAGYGPGRMVPRYQRFAGGVLLNFAVTNDNFIIDFFNKWFNLIYSGGRIKGNYQTPFQLSFYNDIIYSTTMEVKLLDPNGGVNKTFTFYEVYPLENIPLELNMLRPNEYLIYQVLMNYRDFTVK
jgi:hypothetical protein